MIKNNFRGKVAIITGGAGALGFAMARSLADEGVKVALLGRTENTLEAKVNELHALGGHAMCLTANVLNSDDLNVAKAKVLQNWGRIDVLINAAGGNLRGATIMPEESFFDMDINAFDSVTELNLKGTVLPTLVFGKEIAKQPTGCIINISSIAASQVLTRVIGYSAAKAAIESFTKWMAVEMAQKLSNNIRVNAIAPGFFIGKQNKHMLLNEDGTLTERGKKIIDNTPMKRFGEVDELASTVLWLCSDTSSFVNGIVVPVDGGFSAFSGV